MIARLLMGVFEIAHWRKAWKDADAIEDDKTSATKDIAYQLELPHIIILISVFLFGVILNVISWKYHRFVQFTIHYELIFSSVYVLVPYDYGDVGSF